MYSRKKSKGFVFRLRWLAAVGLNMQQVVLSASTLGEVRLKLLVQLPVNLQAEEFLSSISMFYLRKYCRVR